jgi:hypothetical protein
MTLRVGARSVTCAAGLLLLLGCFGHTTYIKLHGSNDRTLSLTDAEIEIAATAIDLRLEPLGVVTHPKIDHVRTIHRESKEVPFLVLHEWVNGPDSGTADDVEVFVQRDKSSGATAIVIRNRTWPRRTQFTDALEASVRAALAEAVPARELAIEHRVEGPSFAP